MLIWSNLSTKVNSDEKALQLQALSCWILSELAKNISINKHNCLSLFI